jgi:NAD+ diphosphatase
MPLPQRLLLMAAILSAAQGFVRVPAGMLLHVSRNVLSVPQRTYGAALCSRLPQTRTRTPPLRRLAMAAGAGEIAAREPRVGPTAAQSSGATSTWPNYYCAPDLERNGRDELMQPGAMSAALSAADSRFVLVWQGKNLFNPLDGGEYAARFLSPVEAETFTADPNAIVIFLGKLEGSWVFGLDVSHLDQVPQSVLEGSVLEQLRSVGGLITRDHDAGLLASARGMSVWHRATKFCSKCGSGDMKPVKVGTSRACGNCGARDFPRTDPSVIVAVQSHERTHLLMGRKAVWPEGRYSTLAGFSEMGESLEECVLREVLEESGVRVARESVFFSSSQPWPFPRSLMIGFQATAEQASDFELPCIKVQEDEMQDVRWFTREQVRAAIQGKGDISIPGRASLAYSLITAWSEAPEA